MPTFQLMFGGIVEARRAAGLPATPFTFTDEEIVAALRSLKERLGRFPTHSDINSYARRRRFPSVGTIYNRLGPLSRLREWV